MDIFSLNKKVALVTGGGSGIGQAICELFGERGATVHILELNLTGANQTLEAIKEKGGKGQVHEVDVSNQAAVLDTFKSIGRVDILVNCAGIAHVGKLEDTKEADFDRLFKVNVKGVYNGMLAAIGPMVAQGGGVILNMASAAATVGIPDRFAYSMTKGAVITMTLSVAKDYVRKNIRCNCMSPGRVHTPFVDGFIAKNYPGKEKEMFEKLSLTQPIGRMAKPAEIAFMALYLCSDEASFVTGCDYPIDGGFIRLNN